MEKSLIRKMLLLISGIMISSLLFFAAVSLTYDTFYRQTLIKDNSRVASNWTSSIDNRLNAAYEHIFDVANIIYRKIEIRSGSAQIDYVGRNDLIDVLESKIMASSDISAIFVTDTESEIFLYFNSPVISILENNNLKFFLRDYSVSNSYSVRNRQWKTVKINEDAYYYNAMKLGKYVIGAVSSFDLYGLPDHADGVYVYIDDKDGIYPVRGDRDLISLLDRDKGESYFDGGYVIIRSVQNNADATTYLVARTEGIGRIWRMASFFLVADSAVCVILAMILIYNTNHRVKEPIRDLIDANRRLSEGNFEYKLDVSKAGSSEFEGLYGSFNEMSDRIKDLTIEQYDSEIKRQQNQLKMLRAQVKPHTFLNAINTINNLTYTGSGEDIRQYISAFASFTRYMLYKAKDWTIVEDEIRNINSYAKMQQIRFPESIEIIYDIDPEIYSEQIPYLTLFSLVQNSFKHAMTLEDKAYINISGEYYEEEGFKGFRLIEEDNGPGFSEEALKKLATAEEDDPFTKEHLGLTNVRYSLNLIYRRNDLLRISNKKEGGAHIELLIPEQEVGDETADL